MAALATAVSLPTTLTAGMSDVLSFLLGAALWLLDYMTVRELDDKLEELLPSIFFWKKRTMFSLP